MSKTISKLLLNGEEYQIKDAKLSDRVTSLETLVGDGVDVDLSGFYTKGEVDDKISLVNGNISQTVNAAVADIIDGAPEQLDTLKEIADTLNKDTEGGVVNSILTTISTNKTELEGKIDAVEGRLDTLEAVDTDNFITGDDLVNYATKNDVDDKITTFNAGLANTYYTKTEIDGKVDDLNDSIDTVQANIDAVDAKVDAIESYDDTDVKSRLDALEAIDHDEYLKGAALDNYYTKTEIDTTVSNLATAVDNTLADYAKTADVNTAINNAVSGLSNYDDTAISNRVTALEDKKTVDVVQNGVYFEAQPNVMYFVFEDGDGDNPNPNPDPSYKEYEDFTDVLMYGVDFAALNDEEAGYIRVGAFNRNDPSGVINKSIDLKTSVTTPIVNRVISDDINRISDIELPDGGAVNCEDGNSMNGNYSRPMLIMRGESSSGNYDYYRGTNIYEGSTQGRCLICIKNIPDGDYEFRIDENNVSEDTYIDNNFDDAGHNNCIVYYSYDLDGGYVKFNDINVYGSNGLVGKFVMPHENELTTLNNFNYSSKSTYYKVFDWSDMQSDDEQFTVE